MRSVKLMAERLPDGRDLALDHVIHVVHDPNRVRLQFERLSGVHTVSGGQHTTWGTYNALCYFGLAYMEG